MLRLKIQINSAASCRYWRHFAIPGTVAPEPAVDQGMVVVVVCRQPINRNIKCKSLIVLLLCGMVLNFSTNRTTRVKSNA